MRLCVVLPAYNEAENIGPIFGGFRTVLADSCKLELRFILVDDGSTDGTPAKAREAAQGLGLEILLNERNRGLAETFRRGMTRAAETATGDGDIIVCMDADNSHLPGQVMRIVGEIREGRDVVIASRYRPGAVIRGVPAVRRFLSWGMSVLFRLAYPIKGVRDYSCGYRGYRAGFLRKALASQGDRLFSREGFACMLAILIRLDKEGAIFGEIPLVLRYDTKQGASKMKVAGTIFRTFRVLLRERFSRT